MIIQKLLPIAEQELSGELARDNIRYLNCWIGIATKDNIGDTFCVECEYLERCQLLYKYFDGIEELHPAARARAVLEKFGIVSEYL